MPRWKAPARILLVGTLAACAGEPTTSPPSTQAAKGSGQSDIPVTSFVADADLSVAPTLQVRSDGLGAYSNSSTLTSVMQPIGAWVLDSYNPRNATRRVFLDFGQPIAGTGPNAGAPAAVPSGLYRVRMISKCNLYGTAIQTLDPGASISCPLHIRFDYNGGSYAVQMNPLSGDPDGSYSETNPVTVTCTAPYTDPNFCAAWRITPSGALPGGAPGSGNVAKLLKYTTSKGKTTPANQGDFYFSFALTFTFP